MKKLLIIQVLAVLTAVIAVVASSEGPSTGVSAAAATSTPCPPADDDFDDDGINNNEDDNDDNDGILDVIDRDDDNDVIPDLADPDDDNDGTPDVDDDDDNCPPPNAPIEHIVVLMQENRSFDNYFGHLRDFDPTLDVEPRSPLLSNPDPTNPNGPPIHPFHQTKLCEVADLDHSWNGTHRSWNLGAMDGFTLENSTAAGQLGTDSGDTPEDPKGSRAMGFYTDDELPFYYDLYSTFAMADRYFSSALTQTFPNRFYELAGTSFVDTKPTSTNPNDEAETRNRLEEIATGPGFNARTIFHLMDEANPPVTWKYYGSETPLTFGNAFSYSRLQPQKVLPISQYFVDAAAGTLPQVAFIDPIFIGPRNVENDEHPPANVQVGQNFVGGKIDPALPSGVLTALFKSPNWPTSAFFLIYDEHGGLWDHVPPPSAIPPDNAPPMHDDPGTNDLRIFGGKELGFDRLGIRIPAVVVSPFSKRHFVSHKVYDETSPLRFIELRFGLPALTNRDRNADPMLDMFDFKNPPAFLTPPPLSPATVDLTRPECIDAPVPPFKADLEVTRVDVSCDNPASKNTPFSCRVDVSVHNKGLTPPEGLTPPVNSEVKSEVMVTLNGPADCARPPAQEQENVLLGAGSTLVISKTFQTQCSAGGLHKLIGTGSVVVDQVGILPVEPLGLVGIADPDMVNNFGSGEVGTNVP